MSDKVFIVIEMQTNGTEVATITNKYTESEKALQKYFQILAAAVTSKVEVHTAIMLTETGRVIRAESYKHESEE
jgi:ribose 5-phosphate isomerase RpiB